MLYTLLVGKPPFDTDAVKSTLTRVVMADYNIPLYLSDNAKDLIERLLKKNPRERMKLRDILKHPFINSIGRENYQVGSFVFYLSIVNWLIYFSLTGQSSIVSCNVQRPND